MAKEYGRNARVSSQMQKELASILLRDVDDPRLGFVTVNEVVLSKDLAVAKIFVTVLNVNHGDTDSDATVTPKEYAEQLKKNCIRRLNELAPFIRHELAKRMRLRHISELRFFYDDSFDTGMRVAELLSESIKHDED